MPKRTYHSFIYQNLEDLNKELEKLGIKLPLSYNVDLLKTPKVSSHIFIPNRISIQPMEGFDANSDGTPSELTLKRYIKYAQGGVGLIWFEATAISESCRSNSHQLHLNEKNADKFKRIITKVREECNHTLHKLGFKDKCILILQLNHSGRYSKLNSERFPIRAYHNMKLDRAIKASKEKGVVITDKELNELKNIWVKKALIAQKVGFDGVDIKACHGYLINELLSSRIRENSIYGGMQLEHRTKFLLDIIRILKNKISSDNFLITTRLSIYDGIEYPYGFGVGPRENSEVSINYDLSEPIKLIKDLYTGGVKLINLTCGNPHFRPYITRPFDDPVKGEPFPPEHPLLSLYRIMDLTGQIKKTIPRNMIVIGSGFSYLRHLAGYLAAGMIENNNTDICGFGRMAFANPNFPKQIFKNGIIDKKETCIACSKCSELMKLDKHTGCVIRNPEYKNN